MTGSTGLAQPITSSPPAPPAHAGSGESPVARIEPPGPAFGRPDDKLREMRGRPPPDFAALNPGYEAACVSAPVANAGLDNDNCMQRADSTEREKTCASPGVKRRSGQL